MTTKKFNFNIRVNPSLDRYDGRNLFPSQVARATEFLRKAGLPEPDYETKPSVTNQEPLTGGRDKPLELAVGNHFPMAGPGWDDIKYFATDELLDDFLEEVDEKPEQEIKAVLEYLLVQEFSTKWEDIDFRHSRASPEINYESNDYISLATSAWEKPAGLAWVLNLIPAFPLEAIKSIDAYLLANWSALPSRYAAALGNCEAIIRTKYLNHLRPKQLFDDLSARDFELLVASLYERLGYRTQRPAYPVSQYADMLAIDANDADNSIFLIQCKATDRAIGIAETRRLLADIVATNSVRGVLITTSRFSAEAKRFAAAKPSIELIDYEALIGMFTVHLGTYWPSKVDKYISEQKPKQLQHF